MRQQMFQQFGGAAPQEMDLASILPDEMFAEQAERRVKLGLVMAEMISQSELTAEPAKVREAIEDIASTYQDPEEVINWYYSENEQLAGIESRVLEDAVVDKLLSEAAIAEIECSYQDALAKARPDAPAYPATAWNQYVPARFRAGPQCPRFGADGDRTDLPWGALL